MLYCRSGKDSDVYVWCGLHYNVAFSEGHWGVSELMEDHGLSSCQFDDPKELLDYLIKIRELGFKVPHHATERLKWELSMPNTFQEYLDSLIEEDT
jgi:hypothetical protein